METNKTRIEQSVADTILGNTLKVRISGKVVDVPRPTLSTIIEVSKMVAEYPFVDFNTTNEKLVPETIRIAKEFDGIENVLAMLIIGKKRSKVSFNVLGREIVLFDRVKRLGRKLKDDLTAREVAEIIVQIFASMDCGFFLATITSLNTINHLKATKTETT
jgi:hypothetical protein